LTQKAIEAEKSGSELASYYWFWLATEQAKSGLCAESVKNAKHGLEIHKKIGDGCNFYSSGMIPDPQPLLPGMTLIDGIIPNELRTALASCGRSSDVDSLLQDAIAKANDIYGAESSLAVNQRYKLAISRALRDDNFDALDEVLQVKPRLLEVGINNSVLNQIYNLAETLMMTQEKQETAKRVLLKLLGEQRSSFEADDLRLVKTLKLLAKVNEKQGHYEDSVNYLSEASSIHQFYNDVGNSIANLQWLLADSLEKAGRKSEARRIRFALKSNKSPSLSDIAHKAEQVSADSKLNDGEKIERILSLDAQAKQHKKYSYSRGNILERLFGLLEKNQKWPLLVDVASARFKIYEQVPDYTAGRQFGCVVPQYRRMDYYLIAAKAYLKSDRKEEAEQVLKRALRIMADVTPEESKAAKELLAACGTESQPETAISQPAK
jgi:hypothetical protein